MIHKFSQDATIYRGNFLGNSGFIGHRSDMEREYPLIQSHNVESADVRMAMNTATETCNIAGALIDIHQRTDNHGNTDQVWDEDADPTYWPAVPMKAFFAPGAVEVALKTWGPDSIVKLEMYFSLQYLVDKFGERVLRPGDVVYVPFNAIGNAIPRYFRIINFTPIGNYKYVWLYAKCNCESLTADINVTPRDLQANLDGVRIGDYNDE